MHKNAFLTDIHAYLPALKVAPEKIDEFRIDEIIIGGDCIGIGLFPRETLKLVMDIPNSSFINGNHELVAIHSVSKFIELNSEEELNGDRNSQSTRGNGREKSSNGT